MSIIREVNCRRCRRFFLEKNSSRSAYRSKIDFVIFTDEGNFGIEVNADKRTWAKGELRSQILKYNQDGKLKYDRSFVGVVLTSPKGRFGFSLKRLAELLKNGCLKEIIYSDF